MVKIQSNCDRECNQKNSVLKIEMQARSDARFRLQQLSLRHQASSWERHVIGAENSPFLFAMELDILSHNGIDAWLQDPNGKKFALGPPIVNGNQIMTTIKVDRPKVSLFRVHNITLQCMNRATPWSGVRVRTLLQSTPGARYSGQQENPVM
jgi:hypothetical protein